MSNQLIDRFLVLENKLIALNSENCLPGEDSKKAICMLTEFLNDLEKTLETHQFKSKKIEIEYYKHYLPKVYQKLYYHNIIKKIEGKLFMIFFDSAKEIEILEKQRESLKGLTDNEKEIIAAYGLNSMQTDEQLFLREHYKWRKENFILAVHDSYAINTVSEIIGKRAGIADAIQYINQRICQLKNQNETNFLNQLNTVKVEWTESKTSLSELIYGLHLSKAINNGKMELNLLVNFFEQIFNIDLKNFNSTVQNIKGRKEGQTKFIDSMNQSLLKKLND